MVAFSVLMAIYEKENPLFLKQAFDSIMNQSLPPSEIVLVKDGPLTQELDLVIQEYEKKIKHLKIYSLKQNNGLGNALNFGLNYCKYDIIARMDTDDVAIPIRFERQVKYILAHPELSVLGGHIYEFKDVPGDLDKLKKVPLLTNEIIRYSRLRNPINHPTAVFRKKDILSVGSYKHMPLFEDYYLWMRLLKNGYKIENFDMPVLYFRISKMYTRRHGLSYFKKEIFFFKTLKQEKIINTYNFFILIMVRLPFRILPRSILKILYNTLLREGSFLSKKLKILLF